MKIIGITGGVATGKSTVSRLLKEEYQFPVIDADEISHEVSAREDVLQAIKSAFGEDVFTSGNLNRSKLAQLVFSDENKKKTLEVIIHPAVSEEYVKQKQHYDEKGEKIVFFDCPLLVEADLIDEVDKILLVYAPKDAQIERLIARNLLSEEEADIRVASQTPIGEKVRYADYIIYNTGDYDSLKRAVACFVKEIREDA